MCPIRHLGSICPTAVTVCLPVNALFLALRCKPFFGEDLWSIGVITYILLCGYPPFYGKNDAEIFASVRRGQYEFQSPEWDTVSNKAKDFVNALLMVKPADRPTASQVCVGTVYRSVDKVTVPLDIHHLPPPPPHQHLSRLVR